MPGLSLESPDVFSDAPSVVSPVVSSTVSTEVSSTVVSVVSSTVVSVVSSTVVSAVSSTVASVVSSAASTVASSVVEADDPDLMRYMVASIEMNLMFLKLAEQYGVEAIDAAAWNIPMTYDGVHFTMDGQKAFAVRFLEERI